MKLEVALLWLVSFALLLWSYVGIIQPEETIVRAHTDGAASFAERIGHMETILQHESALREAHIQIVSKLSPIVNSENAETQGAIFIRSIAREAARSGIAILAIAPGAIEQTSTPIRSQEFLVSIHGSYQSVIAFLPQLCKTDPLLEIRSVSVRTDQSPNTSSKIALRVDISTRLYHIDSHVVHGDSHA